MPTVDDVAKRLMIRWLRSNFTGCSFATSFASESGGGQIVAHVINEAPRAADHLGEEIEPVLVEAAAHEDAILFIFPDVRTENDVARIINGLCRHSSWEWEEIAWREHPRNDILIALRWMTPRKNISTSLGLAPFGSMPLTRRAPYVCIALWPGGHQNPHWPYRSGKRVSLADMSHTFDEQAHERMRLESEQKKREFLDGQFEGAADHRVTFCLPGNTRDLISVPRSDVGREG